MRHDPHEHTREESGNMVRKRSGRTKHRVIWRWITRLCRMWLMA